jgi:H+-transporting ATPase
MEPIGWKWAMFVWAYALFFFFLNDIIKMFVYKVLRHKKVK